MALSFVAGATSLAFILTFIVTDVCGYGPVFDTAQVNVTALSGQTAVLPCSIINLGKPKDFKVIWENPFSTLLTLDDRRIIDDPRIHVERPSSKDWNLHIRRVSYSDSGLYRCSINTVPVKMKPVKLIVVGIPVVTVPITDISQYVGMTTGISCFVDAHPLGRITWYRNSSDLSIIPRYEITENKVNETETESVLVIRDLQKSDFGMYMCYGENTVGHGKGWVTLHELNPRTTEPTENQKSTTTGKFSITAINQHGGDSETDTATTVVPSAGNHDAASLTPLVVSLMAYLVLTVASNV